MDLEQNGIIVDRLVSIDILRNGLMECNKVSRGINKSLQVLIYHLQPWGESKERVVFDYRFIRDSIHES